MKPVSLHQTYYLQQWPIHGVSVVGGEPRAGKTWTEIELIRANRAARSRPEASRPSE